MKNLNVYTMGAVSKNFLWNRANALQNIRIMKFESLIYKVPTYLRTKLYLAD